jgi:hypothetical protein
MNQPSGADLFPRFIEQPLRVDLNLPGPDAQQLDAWLDLSELHAHLSEFYSHTGRPSVGLEVLIRMLIVGYCYGIRSERRLFESGFEALPGRRFGRW